MSIQIMSRPNHTKTVQKNTEYKQPVRDADEISHKMRVVNSPQRKFSPQQKIPPPSLYENFSHGNLTQRNHV